MIELQCHVCGALHAVSRADMLAMPVATYRTCPSCRETAPPAPCVVAWSERSRYWAVVVPRCGRTHYHGGGTGEHPDLGHRASHCLDRSGSYELAETDESRRERARRAAA
jgi:hypothetical protein